MRGGGAPDGVIEAIEAPSARYILGVQWHAEGLVDLGGGHARLFPSLVAAAREHAAVRRRADGMSPTSTPLPRWAEWQGDPARPYTVGIEEEVMLLEAHGWSLTHPVDSLLASLAPELRSHVSAETHTSALELATGVHDDVGAAASELRELRAGLVDALSHWELRAASAGTHPFATWHDTMVSAGERHQERLRLDARAGSPRADVRAARPRRRRPTRRTRSARTNRLRAHLPLLLALSANSPFWQGRDTGLASTRTPLFQAFPRVGIPRGFAHYADYVEASTS